MKKIISLLIFLTVCRLSFSQPAALRINVGAEKDFTDPEGRRWKADSNFDGGQIISNPVKVHSFNNPWIYQKARLGAGSYNVNLSDGKYLVALHFVETDSFAAIGSRIFDLVVGNKNWQNIDIYNFSSGAGIPYIISSVTEVKNKTLKITLKPKKGKTTLSGIEIIPWQTAVIKSTPGELVFENFSKFKGNSGELQKRCTRWVVHNEITPSLEKDALQKGKYAMRCDYKVNTMGPYAEQAWFDYQMNTDLTGYSSVEFWVKPDGSNRKATVTFINEKNEQGSIQFYLKGYDPFPVRSSLKNLGGVWWPYYSKDNPSFNGPIKGMNFHVHFDQPSVLGEGTIYFGNFRALKGETSPVMPPPVTKPFQEGNTVHIENFDIYATDRELWNIYGWTSHGGMAMLSLDTLNKCDGKNSLRMDYRFGKRGYSGFVMFKDLDLTGCNVFRLWVKPDNKGNFLKLFFAIGGRYEFHYPLFGTQPIILEIPFKSFLGRDINLKQNIEIGYWVQKNGNNDGGTIYFDQIEAAYNPSMDLSPSPYPEPYPLPGSEISRIDCGSADDKTDKNGSVWLSDRGYYWGNPSYFAASNDYSGSYLVEILRSERFGGEGYGFKVPNGDFTVNLYFAESWEGAKIPGRRVFGLEVNGIQQKEIDVCAEAGGLYKPMVRSIKVHVQNNLIQILLHPKANHPKIDGIEIIPELR
jgi:hypothetical protein